MNPPPLLHTWHAHETCIVSVDYVNHDVCGAFVVSASTDKTAKLWTTNGHCVGVFGQVGRTTLLCKLCGESLLSRTHGCNMESYAYPLRRWLAYMQF